LAAAEVIKRSRRENRIIEERIDTPHAKGRRPVDDQGQKVLKPKGRLLTIQEAADYLGIARASLAGRGWRVKNRLPAIKVGRAVRFDIKMLDQWIERHRERLPRLSDATDAGNLD
jgi:excisionase family DNA binding protein